jgi:hypothetical protein
MSAIDAVDGALPGDRRTVSSVGADQAREPIMAEIVTIGLDIAKSVFQVHGVDVAG